MQATNQQPHKHYNQLTKDILMSCINTANASTIKHKSNTYIYKEESDVQKNNKKRNSVHNIENTRIRFCQSRVLVADEDRRGGWRTG